MAALVPVMFVVGLLVAFAIEGLVAPDTVGDQRSLTSDLLGALATAGLVLVPAVGAWRLGDRAETLGFSSAPRLAGAILAAGVIVIVMTQLLLNAGRGHY